MARLVATSSRGPRRSRGKMTRGTRNAPETSAVTLSCPKPTVQLNRTSAPAGNPLPIPKTTRPGEPASGSTVSVGAVEGVGGGLEEEAEGGAEEASVGEETAFPLSGTVWGLPPTLSLMDTAALWPPTADGLKEIPIEQVPPGEIVV